jgi:cytochrome c-type biogenesis protein CcmH/NrfG
MLIAEDDTVPEVWYLLGLALHAGGEFDDALTAANEAERLVTLRRHEAPGAGETLLDIEDLKVHTSFQIFHAFV